MRRALLIGLIVTVLAVSGIGAAFATNLSFTNVGALSMGRTEVKHVNVDYIGFELDTGSPGPGAPASPYPPGVVVDGVYISFVEDIISAGENETVIFVSLRDANWLELAYGVALLPVGETLDNATVYKFQLADGTRAHPELVEWIKVTVSEQSSYSTGGNQDYGKGGAVVQMPGVAP